MPKLSRSILFQLGLSFSALILLFGLLPISQPAIGADETAAISAGDGSVLLIQNVGQFPEGALYKAMGGNASTWLVKDGFWVTLIDSPEMDADTLGEEGAVQEPLPLTGVNIKVTFVGANPEAVIEPIDRLETSVNYFQSNDRGQWRSNVPVWGGVRYNDLYPGIDLEVFSESGQFFQQLVVSESADLSLVKLDIQGTDVISADNGQLLLSTSTGDYTLPLIQVTGSTPEDLPVPVVTGNLVSSPFIDTNAITKTNVSIPEDSRMIYGTFLGRGDSNVGTSIALGSDGSGYVTGNTSSENFPTTPGVFSTEYPGISSVYIARLNSQGTGLNYATYLAAGIAYAIAVDSEGAAFVTGKTGAGFPVTENAFDKTYNDTAGLNDTFITKINPTGSELVFSTYLGGASEDSGQAIALGADNSVFVAGHTNSIDFPLTENAFDHTAPGTNDTFAAKLSADGSSLVYATKITGCDIVNDLVIDSNGSAIVVGKVGVGQTASFPVTANAFDPTYNGSEDGFIAKFNSDGSELLYGSYFGGYSHDKINGVTLGTDGSLYVVGDTSSPNLPSTEGVFQPGCYPNGCQDTFITRFEPGFSNLIFSTYLGGNSVDNAIKVVIGPDDTINIVGNTQSTNFPVTANALYSNKNRVQDTYIASLSSDGSSLVYATYLGGDLWDYAKDIAVEPNGNVTITGYTDSADFPTLPGSFDTSIFYRDTDAFILRIGEDLIPPEIPTLISPIDGMSEIGAPKFTWKSQTDAAFYILEYDNDPDFSSPVYISEKIKTPYLKTSREDVGVHYWHVKALDLVGNESEWSETRSVEMVPPIPAPPGINVPSVGALIRTNTPILKWVGVPYGIKYRVQVSTSSTFDTLKVNRTVNAPVTQFKTPALPEGKLFWRVNAVNAYGKASVFTKAWSFTVDTVPPGAPVLLGPGDNSTVFTIPTFRWKATPGAKYHRIYYTSTKGGYWHITNWFTGTSYTPSSIPNGEFVWHVRAKDAAGNVSEWSEYWNVTVRQ